MKRIWVAVVLLLICGIVSASEFYIVRKSCDDCTQALSLSEKYISDSEYNELEPLVNSAIQEWQKSRKGLNIFLLHEKADNISENLSQLREHAKNMERDKFISLAEKTKRQLLRLKQSELPDFENIL